MARIIHLLRGLRRLPVFASRHLPHARVSFAGVVEAREPSGNSTYRRYSLQIQGSKEFALFPPDDARYLYVNAQAGFSGNRSAVDVRDPDVAKKFPLFQLAARSTVTIGPGDALFVPDGWWHTARCVSEAPSVTLGGNYVDASNYDAFSDAFADYLAVKALGSVGASFLN